LRIQAKKLRYAAEFFGPAFPRKRAIRRRKDFVASLQQLQAARRTKRRVGALTRSAP